MAKIQIKRGLQANVENLVLAEGEFAVATDTGNVYIGTTAGTTHVNPKGGTAESAAKLSTAQNFSISGDATASAVSFDGTAAVNLVLALASQSGLTAGTYTKLTVNGKGIVTNGGQIELTDLPTIPTTKISGLGTAATAATGTSPGNVVVVGSDGKIASALIPTLTASDVGAVPTSEKGVAGGVATLDSNGTVPSSQLPSFVDDVIEGYLSDVDEEFYKTEKAAIDPVSFGSGNKITGETGKIYVDLLTQKTYRWSGSAYVEISSSLALGETSESAYRGDRGKTAYDHSQITSGNPHGTTASDVGAAPSSHTTTVASTTTLGHVQIGTGLTISNGVVSLGDIDGGTF